MAFVAYCVKFAPLEIWTPNLPHTIQPANYSTLWRYTQNLNIHKTTFWLLKHLNDHCNIQIKKKRNRVINLDHPRRMSTKLAANEIQIHARAN